MKAAVCRAFGAPLAIEEVDLEPPGKGEIEVSLKACAICHSDISAAEGIWGGTLPAIYGHEASGVVSACGPGSSSFAPGDRVLVTLIRACGSCPSCDGGAPTSCDHAWDAAPSPIKDRCGASVARGINTGGFAQRVVVAQSQCVALPPDVPFDVTSLLACGVINGFGAVVNTAKLTSGQSAAVVGVGGVGLNTVQVQR